ncbi:MAG: methyltransferase domain-containing protein [Candidatus Parvarchaeota archaeon]|nr:methyltransferase domain-containing protein [Candidatus Parvarchaeota archaeon]
MKRVFFIGENAVISAEEGKDINTEFGIIYANKLKGKKPGSLIKTHKGVPFIIVEPSSMDLFRKFVRSPQIITLKDLGSIIAYTGINSKSKILDAGTGSGFAACILSTIAKKVVSYEIREDFAKIAEKNKALFHANNLKIIKGDVGSALKEKGFDVALLDLPEPHKVIGGIKEHVKVGGYIVCYLPSTIQVEKLLRSIPEDLKVVKLLQNLELQWKADIESDILRPESSGITHTAFVIILRRYLDKIGK